MLLGIYHLTLHPLSKYPGPFLSKINPFSVFLKARTGDRHLIQLAEHRKYGPVVRIAPNQLSFADPVALRSIYQSGRASSPLRKAPWYETVDAPSGPYSTHTEISRTEHAFRRRVKEQASSDSVLRAFEPLIIDNVDTLLKVTAEEPEQNVSTLATYFAYDVMGDLVFGKRCNCMASPEHRFMPKLIMASSASIYAVAHLPFQAIVRLIICCQPLINLFGGQLEKDGLAYIAYANDRVTERLASPKSSRQDIMHHMIHARDLQIGQAFTRRDLDAESSLLIAAGADTTDTTLAAALFYLTIPSSASSSPTSQPSSAPNSPNPPPSTAPPSQLTPSSALSSTRHSAFPHLFPRTVFADPGITIAGHCVPKGTIVGCAAYVLHRDL